MPKSYYVKKNKQDFTRRNFLRIGFLAACSCGIPSALSAAVPRETFRKTLTFYHTHTGETLQADYWLNGQYQPEALKKIDHFLRDHRNGKSKPINTGLLDTLHHIHTMITSDKPFHVISGYRSPETNSYLRHQKKGVAKKSFHLKGEAVDIRVPGVPLKKLRRIAMELKMGGVGYYPGPDFVHVDVGPVRCW